MKKFSEDHGGVAIILIVIAVLLLIVGSVKGLDETTGKVNGSGVASVVGNAYSNAIDKFKNSFDETLASGNVPTSGPNGEALVSKTESQVGKYADIDGDGTVDGIVFAALSSSKTVTWHATYDYTASIKKKTSLKNYYVSQKNYTNALGGTADVLTPIGSGNARFYIIALSDISSNTYHFYTSATPESMPNYKTLTSKDFGSGKTNTSTLNSLWMNEACGKKNADSNRKDLWSDIQNQIENGWFLPSLDEWTVFAANLNINDTTNKGLSENYYSSTIYGKIIKNEIMFYSLDFTDGCGVRGSGISTTNKHVRLMRTI